MASLLSHDRGPAAPGPSELCHFGPKIRLALPTSFHMPKPYSAGAKEEGISLFTPHPAGPAQGTGQPRARAARTGNLHVFLSVAAPRRRCSLHQVVPVASCTSYVVRTPLLTNYLWRYLRRASAERRTQDIPRQGGKLLLCTKYEVRVLDTLCILAIGSSAPLFSRLIIPSC